MDDDISVLRVTSNESAISTGFCGEKQYKPICMQNHLIYYADNDMIIH